MKKRENILNLSTQDVNKIIDACQNPKQPNEKLKRARLNYLKVNYKKDF